MPRFLISFDDGAMDHVSAQDLPAVGEDARRVMRDAKAAGVWIFGAGLLRQQATIAGTDGTVTQGPAPEIGAALGGFAIFEVATRDEAHSWATRLARACRCAQEVREILYDPDS